jgi:hypothetical protein
MISKTALDENNYIFKSSGDSVAAFDSINVVSS